MHLTADYTHLLAGYWIIVLHATLSSGSFFQNGFSRKFVGMQLFTYLFEHSVQTQCLHRRVLEWDQVGFAGPSVDNEDFICNITNYLEVFLQLPVQQRRPMAYHIISAKAGWGEWLEQAALRTCGCSILGATSNLIGQVPEQPTAAGSVLSRKLD